jgi:DNA-binding MarR family transcriptional regulator
MLASKQLLSRIFRRSFDDLSMTTTAPVPIHLDAESSGRLRAVIGRLSRQLRVTPSGLDAELTPTRISLMLTIDRRGPIRISEVAELEGLHPTMLSRSVTQLVDAGLVQRTSDSSDRRAAWVSATAAGRQLAGRMRQERTDAINQALTGLQEDERQILVQAIPAMEALAEQLKGRHR